MSHVHDEGMYGAPSAPPQTTTFCPFCNIHLQYPLGSALIQCPSCNNTIDPNVGTQMRCSGCQCLLAYPPQSTYIQCPRCMTTMDTRTHQTIKNPVQGHAAGNGQAAQPPPGPEPKKKRDPNAPKAVCNAYMIFCKTRRDELKRESPDLPFGKIGAKLGEMWRSMSAEEKKPFEDKAAEDRERYRREMQDYQSGKGIPASAQRETKRQKSSSGAAKATSGGGTKAESSSSSSNVPAGSQQQSPSPQLPLDQSHHEQKPKAESEGEGHDDGENEDDDEDDDEDEQE